MEIEVSFNSNLSITKDLLYEVGNGFNYSLSFYIGNKEYEARINESYLFAYSNRRISYNDFVGLTKSSEIKVDEDSLFLQSKYIKYDTRIDSNMSLGSNRDKQGVEYYLFNISSKKIYDIHLNNVYYLLDPSEISTISGYIEDVKFLGHHYDGLDIINTDMFAGQRTKELIVDNTNLYAGQYLKELKENKDNIFVKPPSIESNYSKEFSVAIPTKGGYMNTFYLVDIPTKGAYKYESEFLDIPTGEAIIDNAISVDIPTFGSYMYNLDSFLGKNLNEAFTSEEMSIGVPNNGLNIYDDMHIENNNKIIDIYTNMYLQNRGKDIDTYKNFSIAKTLVGLSNNNDPVMFDKASIGAIKQDYISLYIDLGYFEIRQIEYPIMISHVGKRITDGIYEFQISKNYHDMDIFKTDIWFDRTGKKIGFNDNIKGFNPFGKPIFENIDYKFFERKCNSIDVNNIMLNLYKGEKAVSYGETEVFATKIYKAISEINTDLFLIKYPTPVYHSWDDISVSKGQHVATFDYKYGEKNFNKIYKDTKLDYNSDYVWISNALKDAMIEYEYTWIEKNIHDTRLEYSILSVLKDGKGITINDDIFAAYSPKAIDVQFEYTMIKKDSNAIHTEYMLNIYKKNAGTQLNYILNILKDSIATVINEDMIKMYKESNAIRFDNGNLSFDRETNIAISDKYISFTRKKYGFMNFEKNLFVGMEANELFFEDNLGFNYTHDVDFTDNTSVKKHKIDTHIDDYNPFVTVIHYDGEAKPYYDGDNIDELILPYNDFDYGKFLNKLIDIDGNIDVTYVESYDSVTEEYTVKIPVEHPIDIYGNVGRDYVDLDVSILNIFIYIVRKLWKDNMYKYIAMPALDSIKHMMINIYVELDKAYKLDDKQRYEFDRCMNLFRWYSEMSILNNCEYLLKFDTTSSKVNYIEKSLGDLNDMIQLNNMHISSNYILEPIDKTLPSSVTFINPKKDYDTKPNLSFTMYNINQMSSISFIDDTKSSVIVYSGGSFEVSEVLKDKIVVDFIPVDAGDSIAIANISITNIRTPAFTIRYKGKFGEVNKVMQKLLDQMLVVGTISNELKAKLGDVSPVTLAVSTIMEYFEYHHQDKLKGKRLITKK